MPVKYQFRFQYWVLGILVAAVLGATVAFLSAVLGKFRAMAEENAQERFSLIADQAILATDNLLVSVGRIVTRQASDSRLRNADGQINAEGAIPSLIASLAVNPDIYGQYFGLADERFVQVLAIRELPQAAASVAGPPASWFAVRRIFGAAARREHWEYLGHNRELLGSRDAPAEFRPTGRPWYRAAIASNGPTVTPPYLFASTGQLGVTVAQSLVGGGGVFGVDIGLSGLNEFLGRLALSPNAAIALLDAGGRVIAFSGRGRFSTILAPALHPMSEIDDPALRGAARHAATDQPTTVSLPTAEGDRAFVLVRRQAEPLPGAAFTVVTLAPLSDFSGPIDRARQDVLLVCALILLFLVPLSLLGSRRVVHALTVLARNSERLKRLDFSSEPEQPASLLYEINALGDAQIVMQRSIRDRTEALHIAREKLERLVENGLMLAREQNRETLLRHILDGAQEISHCAAATLFLKTDHDTLRFALRTASDELHDFEVPLHDPKDGKPASGYVSSHVALNNETVVIDDVYAETRFDLSGTKRFSEESGLRTVSMLTVPLSPRDGEVIGVLQLMNALDPATGEVIPFPRDLIRFVEALAAQSAITLENMNLLEAQRQLMDALIKLIAGAIDAKSAYTGGHCERVPELAMMLAREACAVDHGPLADFAFGSDEAWREFRIGAWLHDCGKVTTPEYVVDKATKLETLYNRIHEIRTRFEVLLRDAEIERLQAIYERGEPRAAADARFAGLRAQLLDDFAFVAEANLGGEFMAPEKVDRIREIAGRTWLRHFDDRLGLSQDERKRRGDAAVDLPVRENLLADQPWHVLPRECDNPAYAAEHGWQVKVPDNLYNFGEVYNLAIGRGTLTEEERFKINEHIIQTILMLERLPLPPSLARVPEYAGTHHETLNGSGYPRRLDASQLSVPSRIMAIADIFEALTAADRPYKSAKTLSESIRILSFFKKDKHIDPVLFDLFLTSGVYLEYARRYLKPAQIDEVDITAYLG
ncbi:MAG: GAF domain-containing protein [Azonexaceae bacterium]|nr:GAF domain-containing protein [Azonexaceae bacterium]